MFPGTGAGWLPGPGGVWLVWAVLPGAVRALLTSLSAGRSTQGSQAHGAVRSGWVPASGLPLGQPTVGGAAGSGEPKGLFASLT